MIQKLNHRKASIAKEIHRVFQASYKVEAELLGAKDFPPLKRTVKDFMESTASFYGILKDKEIAGIVQVSTKGNVTDINSLVVHPDYFRQGLGKQLVAHVLSTYDSDTFTVETGVDNKPAIQLYERLGFSEKDQWDTSIGIRKIGFIKTM
ncbi:MAG: hypothetical protein Tsb0034_27330 [Ekhidna sp.]